MRLRGLVGDPLLALTLLALVGAATSLLARAPAPEGHDAAPGRFSAVRAMDALEALSGAERPRPAGTPEHAAFRERLVERLEGLGLEIQVQEALAEGPRGNVAVCRNVLARLPGTRDGLALALFAHYDSVGASPGAGDDGSGVACLLEIARALRAAPVERDVLFVFTDAEEVGLVGAQAFLAHPWARAVGVALNLEARGTEGPSVMFESSDESAWLVRALGRSSPRPRTSSLAELVYKTLPNDTDFSVLRGAGIPGLNFAFIGGLPRYHTPRDSIEHLDPRSLQHQGAQALALVRELAPLELERPPRGALAWTDLAGRVLVAWPPAVGPFLALGVLLVTALAFVAGRPRLAPLCSGLAASVLAALGATCAAWGFFAVLSRLAGASDPAAATPLVARALLVSAALGGALLAGGALAARAGAAALLMAQAACAGALALGISLELPAVLPLVLPPALAAGVGALVATRRGALARRVGWALPLCAVALVGLPLFEGLEDSFGFALPVVLGALAGVHAAVLLPALAGSGARGSRAIGLTAGVLALAASALLLALRPYDAAHPAWLNLRFVQNAESGLSRWDVSTFGLAPPPSLAALGLEPAREPPFPWLSFDRSLWVAPAPTWAVPPPAFELLSDVIESRGRVLVARISSPRGATRLHLHRPEGVELVAVRWRDQRIEIRRRGATSTIFCAIPPKDGLEVELLVPAERLAEQGELELWMLDQDWALPPQAARWLAARPIDRVPRADGDVSILGQRFVVR